MQDIYSDLFILILFSFSLLVGYRHLILATAALPNSIFFFLQELYRLLINVDMNSLSLCCSSPSLEILYSGPYFCFLVQMIFFPCNMKAIKFSSSQSINHLCLLLLTIFSRLFIALKIT